MLCTGNICRSPLAEALLRDQMGRRGIGGLVSSAGLAFDGRPADPESIAVGRRLGVDLDGHRSRILTPGDVAAADLIVGMERRHVREVVVADPTALGRTFTFKELVRRAGAAGRRRADEPWGDWLARVGAGRRAVDLLGASPDDDVADPYRRPPSTYLACGDELRDLVDRFVAAAWPTHREVTA